MYSRVFINLRYLPKININKIISKELKYLYTIKNNNNNIDIIKKKINIKTDVKYRSSPW